MSVGAFDQDGDDVPDVVRAYHRARLAYSYSLEGLLLYEAAAVELMSEVECRGGTWDVGRLRYRVDGEGLWVEQRPAADAIGGGDGCGEETLHGEMPG